MKKENIFGVYCITNTLNGKKYVGSTRNYHSRIKDHLKRLRNNRHASQHLQASFNKYGESFFKVSLLEVVTLESLMEKEKEWVLKYNTLDDKFGYNKIIPGKLPIKNNLQKYTKKIIIGVNKDGIIEKIYSSVAEGERELGTGISSTLYKNKKYVKFLRTKGLYWFHKENYSKDKFLANLKIKAKKEKILKPYSERTIKRVPITIQNSTNGEIKEFRSLVEAAIFLGVSKSKIHELRRGFRNKGGGKQKPVNSVHGYIIKK